MNTTGRAAFKRICENCKFWDREGPVIGIFNIPHFACKLMTNSNHGNKPNQVYVMSKKLTKVATVSFFGCKGFERI